MSKPVLYYMLESPNCRTVIAVARILGIQLELKPINLLEKEQYSDEFTKINPFHVVPTFVDIDGFTIWESRAICTYLIQSRINKTMLYPVDLQTRTTVEKFLQYDLGTLSRAMSEVLITGMQGGDTVPKLERVTDTLKTLEQYLCTQEPGNFISGTPYMSLADVSIHFSLTYLDIFPSIDSSAYPKVLALNGKIEQALKPHNRDGLFDRARENVKKLAEGFKAKQ